MRLNISRGLDLVKPGNSRRCNTSEFNKREALRILSEFRRYLDWYRDSVPVSQRQTIETQLNELGLLVLHQSKLPAI